MEDYDKEILGYNEKLIDYEKRLNDYNNSEETTAWNKRREELRNKMKI